MILLISACFGLGLGLSSTMSVAHACKCATQEIWELSLDGVEGAGDTSAERERWDAQAFVESSGVDSDAVLRSEQVHLKLERVQ